MLGGKRKDKTVVTLTFVPADDQILFVVAWKAGTSVCFCPPQSFVFWKVSGRGCKSEIAVNASDNRPAHSRDTLVGLEAGGDGCRPGVGECWCFKRVSCTQALIAPKARPVAIHMMSSLL